jgi:ACDE family multidrug resistance protein
VKRPRHPWLWMVALACVPFLMVLGNSVLIPVLPEMQREMHISRFQTSLLITLFSIPAGITIPIAGLLSDRYSRKWVIIPGLLLFGAGGVVAAVAAAWLPMKYPLVLAGRIVQGVGASGTAPIAMALVGDMFQGGDRSKALGMNEAGNAFGKVMSPIIGAAVALWVWHGVFWVFPALCGPLAVLLWRIIPAEQKPKQAQKSVGSYLQTLGTIIRREGRWLTVAYLAGSGALFTLFGVLFYLSDQLETTHRIAGLSKGLILAIPLTVLTVASLVTGWCIQRRKNRMKWMMVGGLAVLTLSLGTATLFADRTWTLVTLMSLAACGTGAILPSLNTLITSAVSADHRGMVTSFYGSVRFLGVAFGPPVFTWLLGFSPRVMFATVAALVMVCAVLVTILIRPEVEHQPLSQQSAPRAAMRHRARI